MNGCLFNPFMHNFGKWPNMLYLAILKHAGKELTAFSKSPIKLNVFEVDNPDVRMSSVGVVLVSLVLTLDAFISLSYR